MKLSDRGTLLLPVPTEALGLRASVEIGGRVFVPKKEHHITVFGYRMGKLLLEAIGDEPGLRARIDAHVGSVDWVWHRLGLLMVLERDEPRPLATIVELVKAPSLIEFYALIARDSDINVGRWPKLTEALVALPPPHITLYTSDPKGADGIGIDRTDDLDAALFGGEGVRRFRARALDGDETRAAV